MPKTSDPTMTTPANAGWPTGRSASRRKMTGASARSVDFCTDLRIGGGSKPHLSHDVSQPTTSATTNNFCNLQHIKSVQDASLDGLSLGLAGLTHLHRFAPLAVHDHAATAPNPRAAVAPASVAAPNLSWRSCATSAEAPATADLSIEACEASRNSTQMNKLNQSSGNRSFPMQQTMSMETRSSHFNQQSTNVSSSQQTSATTSTNLQKQRQHLSILMPSISSFSSIVAPLELAGQSTNAVAAAAASIASPSIWSPNLTQPSISSHAPTPSIFDFTSIGHHSMNFGLDILHPNPSTTPVQSMHERALVSPPSMHTDTICPGDLHSTVSSTIMSRDTSTSQLSTQYMTNVPVTTSIPDLRNPISARVLFGQSMDTMCCTPMPDTTMPSLLISPQSGILTTTISNNVNMYVQSNTVLNTETGNVLSTFPVSHHDQGLQMNVTNYSMPNDTLVGTTKTDFVYGGASISYNSSRDTMYIPTTMNSTSSSQSVYEFRDMVELSDSGMECPWNTNSSIRSDEVTDNALVNVPAQLHDDDMSFVLDDNDHDDEETTTSKSTLSQKGDSKKPSGGYRRRKAPSVCDLTCPDCGTVFARLSALRSHERMHASAKRALEDVKQRSMQQTQMMNMFGNGDGLESANGIMTDMLQSTIHFGIPATMSSFSEMEPFATTTSGMKRPRHRIPAQLQSISYKARSFVCQVCQSSFIRKQDLRRHQSTKHAGGSFTPAVVEAANGAVIAPSINGIKRIIKCFDCQRTFSRTDALFRHRKSRCKAVVSSTNLVRASDGEDEEE